MPERAKLDGRVAVVTGSTRGIGLAIARELAGAGAHVVINGSSSEEAVWRAVNELPGGADGHLGVRAAVDRMEQVQILAEATKARFGRCDILVNNAGFTRFIPHAALDELSEDVFDRTLGVNLKGPFLCVRAFAPLLRQHPPGLVVNIASIAATTAVGSSVAYCASKAGLVNMTQALARALGPDIRVNSVSPGVTDTELTRGWEEYRRRQIARTPMGRLGTPEDVAWCVLALACDLNFVTGQNIVVDGGRTLGKECPAES